MSEASLSRFVPPVFSEPPTRKSFIRRQPMMTIGIATIVLLIGFAAIGPWFVGDPRATFPGSSFAPPSWSHFFGTDMYGRDVFARAVNAARLDLWLGIVISVVATIIGSLIGLVAGYWGGWVDDVVMRLTDITLAFPGFVLAILLVTVLGGSSTSVAIGVTVSFIPYFIRLTRAEVLGQRELEYVDGAILAGNSKLRVALRHVLPNSLKPSLVQATLVAGWAITTVGGLAFLGIGIHPPTPEWGVMVAEGSNDILTGVWWTALFPGALIVIAASAFQFIGDDLGSKR
ncbi:MAG TPA: ABC transporter permease [Candidatus Nanopelagicaceae bacterium]|nr:ABC transporter permease [Candidatus Nanopelagicaceae bacterium]